MRSLASKFSGTYDDDASFRAPIPAFDPRVWSLIFLSVPVRACTAPCGESTPMPNPLASRVAFRVVSTYHEWPRYPRDSKYVDVVPPASSRMLSLLMEPTLTARFALDDDGVNTVLPSCFSRNLSAHDDAPVRVLNAKSPKYDPVRTLFIDHSACVPAPDIRLNAENALVVSSTFRPAINALPL